MNERGGGGWFESLKFKYEQDTRKYMKFEMYDLKIFRDLPSQKKPAAAIDSAEGFPSQAHCLS